MPSDGCEKQVRECQKQLANLISLKYLTSLPKKSKLKERRKYSYCQSGDRIIEKMKRLLLSQLKIYGEDLVTYERVGMS